MPRSYTLEPSVATGLNSSNAAGFIKIPVLHVVAFTAYNAGVQKKFTEQHIFRCRIFEINTFGYILKINAAYAIQTL